MNFLLDFLLGALGGAAAIGVGVALLKNLVTHRLSMVLETIRSDLALHGYKASTVFSRLDKERATAIQYIDAALREFDWHHIEFTPKSALHHVNDQRPLIAIALEWSIKLQVLAKDALKIIVRHSLLLDDDLALPLGAGWYMLANQVALAYTKEFCELAVDATYKAMPIEDQRTALVAAKNRAAPELMEKFNVVSRDVKTKLKDEFRKIRYEE